MASLEIHTLAWPNVDPRMIEAHTKVTKHFGWNVSYTIAQEPHGSWMENILANSKADIIGFLDIDCFPTAHSTMSTLMAELERTGSFVGMAQVSNHILPGSHIYAAPSCFFIYRHAWEKLDRPTFRETQVSDVAENVSYMAEVKGRRYATMFPLKYIKDPEGGAWPLHTYGKYGIGTLYDANVFHLFQGRLPQNVDLFCEVAECAVNGKMDDLIFQPCRHRN